MASPEPIPALTADHGSWTGWSTRQALIDIFATARSTVDISVAYIDPFGADFLVPLVVDAADRGVRTRLLLRSGRSDSDQNVPGLSAFARRIVQANAAGRVQMFDLRERDPGLADTGLHTKMVLADARRAYIGSANLTKNGLVRNIEVGVVIQGAVVRSLAAALQTWLARPDCRRLAMDVLSR